MSKGYLAVLATLGAFLAPVSHAQLVGLRSEIGRFVTQIDESSQAVSDAMALLLSIVVEQLWLLIESMI